MDGMLLDKGVINNLSTFKTGLVTIPIHRSMIWQNILKINIAQIDNIKYW